MVLTEGVHCNDFVAVRMVWSEAVRIKLQLVINVRYIDTPKSYQLHTSKIIIDHFCSPRDGLKRGGLIVMVLLHLGWL
jgi:hypothetical protein